MNIKNKLIAFFIFILIFTLSIFNVKNPEKIKFYLFTSKKEQISLGNLITLTFVSGFTLSSLLTLISKTNLQASSDDNFINYDEIEQSVENNTYQEFKSDRPPERDVRESQPTISVNYRFVDQDDDLYNSKNNSKKTNNVNNEDNDWLNNDDSW
tara:strand:- start:557 stop:1018 length:462 start_codon:yes stop_codon:yes gene_type:complete